MRSPLRYGERLSAHRLGLDAVTRWRRWLVETVGSWPYARWRDAAHGDLLERSMADTEALQDLWVRGVVPGAATLAAALVADGVLAGLPGRGGWVLDALALAAVQLAGTAVIVARVAPRARADAARRAARGAYQAALVELERGRPRAATTRRRGAAARAHRGAPSRPGARRGRQPGRGAAVDGGSPGRRPGRARRGRPAPPRHLRDVGRRRARPRPGDLRRPRRGGGGRRRPGRGERRRREAGDPRAANPEAETPPSRACRCTRAACRLPRAAGRSSRASTSTSRPGGASRSSGPRARASRPCCARSPASTTPPAAPSTWTG